LNLLLGLAVFGPLLSSTTFSSTAYGQATGESIVSMASSCITWRLATRELRSPGGSYEGRFWRSFKGRLLHDFVVRARSHHIPGAL